VSGGRGIYLAGLSGAGKSTVASLAARWLGARAEDVDAEVERAAARSVAALWAEGGEAGFRAAERRAVEEIVARTGPEAVALVVAHGAVIGELCAQASASRPFAFVHADNGSISRLVVQSDGRWLLRSFNDIAHLTHPTGPAG
jgi:shikimate kinase